MTTGFGWSQPAREYITLYHTPVPTAMPMPAVVLVRAPIALNAVHTSCPEQPMRTPARRRLTALSDEIRAHAVARAASAEEIRA